MWNTFRIFEKFKFDSESCWNHFNSDMSQTKILCLFALQCRIAIKSCCVFFASNMTRFVKKIIEEFANVVKSRMHRANRYVLEFVAIFLLLMIHNYFDSLRSRSWTFDEIRTLFWSLTVRSTIAIIQSISFFVFANFVVALRSEKNISSRWRTFLTREKQHVSNCSIFKQKRKQKIFFKFKFVFSKLSCFVCD